MAIAEKQKTIVFFHPDLGIGGAERLVIDAAVGLQNRGHKIVIFTSYCDPKHCFDEARDGTLDVRAYFTSEISNLKPDAFFVDQLSAGLPWLRYFYPNTRIFFYCHFPDLLLAQGRTHWLKRAYRIPFDFLEQWSMSFAESIAVNSGFTKGMVEQVFPELAREKDLQIVHPCVDVNPKKSETSDDAVPVWQDRNILLSINRFEKKKDIGLAIKAYAGLGKHGRQGVRLVLAGGYDNRVMENVVYHKELVKLATDLGLKTATTRTIVTALNVPDDVDVLFLLSVPNTLKEMLLNSARLLIYTPSNEHFGIVPLEAMLAGVPVLAANTGGPLETVVEGKTGWLCPPDDVEKWTAVMDKVLNKMTDDQVKQMGVDGVKRVKNEFSDVKMAERIDGLIDGMANTPRKSTLQLSAFLLTIIMVALDIASWGLGQNQSASKKLDKFLLPPLALTLTSLISWGVYFVVNYQVKSSSRRPTR